LKGEEGYNVKSFEKTKNVAYFCPCNNTKLSDLTVEKHRFCCTELNIFVNNDCLVMNTLPQEAKCLHKNSVLILKRAHLMLQPRLRQLARDKRTGRTKLRLFFF